MMMQAWLRSAWRHGRSCVVDACIVLASLAVAWSVRALTTPLQLRAAAPFCVLAVASSLALNGVFRLYNRMWCYASADEIVDVAAAAGVATAFWTLADLAWPRGRPVPLSVLWLAGLLSFVGFVSVRYRGRVWTGLQWRWQALRGRLPSQGACVLIVGAGEAGQLLAWRFLNHQHGQGYQPVAFVDDDPAKVGMRVHGIPVLGDRQAIPGLVASRQVDLIVIAIYNITSQAFRDILRICESTPAQIKVLPNVFDFMHRTNGSPPIRDVQLEDLLCRETVRIDSAACRQLLVGKIVLVTGAAGSIGSELCRQILGFGPQRLLLLDNNETGLYDLSVQLATYAPVMRCIIADITNRAKMQTLFEQHRPQVVFHAAAYKHVPLMEGHPDEAVLVNVLGTWNVAELACRHQAERLVFISTDKAVNPSSVMGATKRLAEMLISHLGAPSQTLCTGVRFGNVLAAGAAWCPLLKSRSRWAGRSPSPIPK